MPTFFYTARNAQGQMIKGQTEAMNQSMAARGLRDQGLIPTLIEAGGVLASRAPKQATGKRGRIKLEDLVILTRQFATMIRAGLPLIEVLNILAEQSEKRLLKEIMKQVEKDVGGGASLFEAMSKHKKTFSTFYLSMVMAGEAAGMLDSILDQVATYLEKTASIQRKIKSAIMYPTVVSIVAVLITVFLMVKVVPVFAEIFSDLGGNLPVPTQIVIFISNFLQNNLILAAAGMAGIGLGVWQMARSENGRRALDRFKLRMPIFGPLFLKVAVARFSRTLGTLIRS
ncbi:type II secretion system F family protein, partial [bacterium]|nr:type II secretion system F family protein [bacterium]